eukprot:1372810-Rhodomonas_salina.4
MGSLLVVTADPASVNVKSSPKAHRQPPSWSSKQDTRTGFHSGGNKYIVVAADATAAYAFYLPMTVRIWHDVAGYGAIVLLIGPEWRSQKVPHTRAVLAALAETSAIVHIVDVPHGTYTLSTVAQVSRLLAALTLPLLDDDFLLVVDVDIWPLDSHHFAPKQQPDNVHIFDAFCCGSKPVDWRGFKSRSDAVDPDTDPDWYRVYPAGKGVGMTVRTWKRVMLPSVPGQPDSLPSACATVLALAAADSIACVQHEVVVFAFFLSAAQYRVLTKRNMLLSACDIGALLQRIVGGLAAGGGDVCCHR